MAQVAVDAAIRRALAELLRDAPAHWTPIDRGLIHASYSVATADERWVLQRLSPIFAAEVNHNIKAVTAHLRANGMLTPNVLDGRDGRPWVDLGDDGVWRMLSWIDGATFDTVQSNAQAHSAGHLLGRFHRGLVDLQHTFVGLRAGVHDLPRHLSTLEHALRNHRIHRLHGSVAELGAEIESRALDLTEQRDLVMLIGHGDPKLNNIRFRSDSLPGSDEAICLIDLDTVGPMALAFELGDAWRSWCNRNGEDAVAEVVFDLDVFAASLAGYVAGLDRALTVTERTQLVDGVEWISLELAARFAADALNESYFGWDATRHSSRGDHNLHRARTQLAVHRGARLSRRERQDLLQVKA